VVQPHRYTRLAGLMDDFANAFVEADAVLVAPVYAAGEEPIEGVDAAALADAIRAHGHRMVQTVAGADDLARTLRDLAAEGDLVICMGAGDITKWAAGLEQAMRQERSWKATPPSHAKAKAALAEAEVAVESGAGS
jgi:UDP-N-acetylmuramate--alanine ligase